MNDKLAKYQSFSEDDLADVDQQQKQIQSTKYLKMEVGDTLVRILPAAIDAGWKTFTVVATHYIDPMPGVAQKLRFNCPSYHLKEACSACEYAQRLAQSKNPADQQLAKRLSARATTTFNVLNRDTVEQGPKIVSAGAMLWGKIAKLRRSKHHGDMTHPVTGYDIIINRVGTGQNDTEYDAWPDRHKPLAEDPAEIEEIMARVHDLNSEIDCQVPTELLSAWGGVARAGRTPPTRRSAVEDARASVGRAQNAGQPAAALPEPVENVIETTGVTYDPDDPATW